VGRDPHPGPIDHRPERGARPQPPPACPPRQFHVLELHSDFGKDAANAFKTGRLKRIDFVAERPRRPVLGNLGSKTCRKTITKPKDWTRR
jgi:hypothetical protein